MVIHNVNKINRLLVAWPKGTVAVYPFLKEVGISRLLMAAYQRSGWVQSIGRGAFIRSDDKKVEWPGGLFAIQKYGKSTIHAGGKTALEFLGYAHYLPLGNRPPVWLFGNAGEKLPAWFKNYDWEVKLRYYMTNLFGSVADKGLTEKEVLGIPILTSSPERAIMEYLYLVPQEAAFEEARQLMESLASLRPALVQKLLEQCKSIKVKRVFLFLADYCGHAWLKHLDVTKVNLGKGKRVMAKDGFLDTKYNITIPQSLKK